MTPRPSPIRAVVVDDEPIARERLMRLAAEEGVEVVGHAGDGRSAVEEIRRLSPDLLLLDVRMPVLDGFDVLERLGPAAPPDTIFVTAYDRYAVRAFDAHAVDYVLKPIERDRFRLAIERARERLRHGRGSTARALALDRRPPPSDGGDGDEVAATAPLERLAVRSVGRVRFVRTADVDWIEAADYYSKLHVGDKSHLIRRSMKALEGSLDRRRFVRIHRSTIVNVERVQAVETRLHGAYRVILADGTRLHLSRGRRRALEALMAAR